MKRRQFLKEIKTKAENAGKTYSFDAKRGKGSHGQVKVGSKTTFVPDHELGVGIQAAILKQLGLP